MAKLTSAQTKFFDSYIEEFDSDDLPRATDGLTGVELAARRTAFVTKHTNSNFDGPATSAEVRVAKNLLDAGYLSEAHHHGPHGKGYLSATFTASGMEALFDVALSAAKTARFPVEMSRSAQAG